MFAEEERTGCMAFIVDPVPPLYFQDKKETQHPSGVRARRVWGGVSSKSLYQTVVFHLTVEINSHDMQEREWTCLHGPRLGKPASGDGAIHKIPILLGNQVEGDYVASVTSQHGSVAFSGGHVTSFKVLFAELLGLFISLT